VPEVQRFLKADLKPHQSRYWLNANPEDPETFASEVETVCELYSQALELHREYICSVPDENGNSGVRALWSDIASTTGAQNDVNLNIFVMEPLCLIANMEVATGQVMTPSIGQTCTEVDFGSYSANSARRPDSGVDLYY